MEFDLNRLNKFLEEQLSIPDLNIEHATLGKVYRPVDKDADPRGYVQIEELEFDAAWDKEDIRPRLDIGEPLEGGGFRNLIEILDYDELLIKGKLPITGAKFSTYRQEGMSLGIETIKHLYGVKSVNNGDRRFPHSTSQSHDLYTFCYIDVDSSEFKAHLSEYEKFMGDLKTSRYVQVNPGAKPEKNVVTAYYLARKGRAKKVARFVNKFVNYYQDKVYPHYHHSEIIVKHSDSLVISHKFKSDFGPNSSFRKVKKFFNEVGRFLEQTDIFIDCLMCLRVITREEYQVLKSEIKKLIFAVTGTVEIVASIDDADTYSRLKGKDIASLKSELERFFTPRAETLSEVEKAPQTGFIKIDKDNDKLFPNPAEVLRRNQLHHLPGNATTERIIFNKIIDGGKS